MHAVGTGSWKIIQVLKKIANYGLTGEKQVWYSDTVNKYGSRRTRP